MSSALHFVEWRQGTCTYECPICTTVHRGLKVFFEHIKYVHNNPNAADFIKDSTYMIVKESVKCALCGKVFDHNGWDLKYHVENKHDSTIRSLVAYFELYVDTSDEVMIIEGE